MVPGIKKLVRLRITVPPNVTVVTELIPTASALGFAPPKGMEAVPALMEMDLTSQKTSQWLSGAKRIAMADCNCCCVRG
jgi:hypothetical protein